MSTSDKSKKPAKQAQSREDRLKAALKANMGGRRKAQARVRADKPDNSKK